MLTRNPHFALLKNLIVKPTLSWVKSLYFPSFSRGRLPTDTRVASKKQENKKKKENLELLESRRKWPPDGCRRSETPTVMCGWRGEKKKEIHTERWSDLRMKRGRRAIWRLPLVVISSKCLSNPSLSLSPSLRNVARVLMIVSFFLVVFAHVSSHQGSESERGMDRLHL